MDQITRDWLDGKRQHLAVNEFDDPHHAVPVKRTMDGKGVCKVCAQPTYSDRGIYRHV